VRRAIHWKPEWNIERARSKQTEYPGKVFSKCSAGLYRKRAKATMLRCLTSAQGQKATYCLGEWVW